LTYLAQGPELHCLSWLPHCGPRVFSASYRNWVPRVSPGGLKRAVPTAAKLSIFICRLSLYLGAWISWNP